MFVTAGVSDPLIAISDKFRGKIGRTKVKRYWPGKAPEWDDDNDDDGDVTIPVLEDKLFDGRKDDRDDPRLRRLAESRRNNGDNVQAVVYRRIQLAEIISSDDGDEEETKGQDYSMDFGEEDEDALEERRKRIKEKLLLMRQQEEFDVEKVLEEDDELQEEYSEYETDSDEELLAGGIAMIKPYFVPKLERDTITEPERIEEEERAREELVKRSLEERRIETKTLVVEMIREDEEIHNNNNNGVQLEANNASDVDTDDDKDVEEQIKAWKVRTIARMKRDREEREAAVKNHEEIVKAGKMTEEERGEWETLQKTRPAQPGKRKWAFMQRYYHKGAFFQSDADDPRGTAGVDNIYSRDFSVPTGEDKMNKTIMPKSLQVKHFGRSGRTKWTHLVNEDTTNHRNDPTTSTLNYQLRTEYVAKKMATRNTPLTKPKGSKKMRGLDFQASMLID